MKPTLLVGTTAPSPGVKRLGREAEHFHPVPSLRMSTAIPQFTHTPVCPVQGQIYHYFTPAGNRNTIIHPVGY